MAHMSRRFNFDEFDKLCAEALEEDSEMAEQDRIREEEEAWAEHDRVFLGKRPGEIGGVACSPTLSPELLPEPPQAEVIDLNANVFDLRPPDDAA